MKDRVCRCNKTPTPGSKALPIEVDEYQAPRVATPVALGSGVLIPIDVPVAPSEPRREISVDPPVDRSEDPLPVGENSVVPLPMAEDRTVRIARVSVGSILFGRIESNSRKNSGGTRLPGSPVVQRRSTRSSGQSGSNPRPHLDEVGG